MSTEAQLKALSNSELASGTQIPALKHRTVNDAIIEEMYDAQSRGNVLSGVQTATSLASGDEVFVIRSGEAYLLDADELGFVSTLADLTDVNIPAPSNDQVLAYNFGTSKWVSKDVSSLSSVVSITGTATTNQMVKFTGLSSIGNSNISDDGSTVAITGNLSVNTDDFYVNSSNNRVGVGTSTPATNFQVVGNILADFVATSGNSFTKIFSMDQDIQTTDTVEFAGVTAGSFVTSGGTSTDFVKGDGSLDGTTYQDEAEKNQANGYAPLDSGAKIPLANLPDSILGQVSYQGTWAASTNTPTLANPPASTTKGEYYVASDDGTQFGIDFKTGDWIISNGTAWEKVDNTDAVTSVFGRLGNILPLQEDYDDFYVTLDTAQTINGFKTFNNIQIDGSAGLRLVHQVGQNVPADNTTAIVGIQEDLSIIVGLGSSNFKSFNFSTSLLANNTSRTINIPDASGTLALTTDLNTLNASNITTGTLADARLSSNVALKDVDNNFSVGQTVNGQLTVNNTLNSTIRLNASDTTILGGDIIGTIEWYTNDPSSSGTGVSAQIQAFAENDFAGGNRNTSIAFSTVLGTGSLTERMRIDSSGNVGIGGSASNGYRLELLGSSEAANTLGMTYVGIGAAAIKVNSTGALEFGLDAANGVTERMRIDSSGNVLVGTSTFVGNGSSGISAGNSISLGGSNPWSWFVGNSDNGSYVQYIQSIGTATHELVAFIAGNPSSSMVGSITSNGSSTSYNTSSDYRLKENVVPMTGALDRVDALKPARFNFIADADKTVDGFLAHEVQDIVPEAVTGTKDAMREEEYEVEPAVLDDDGNVITEAVMGTRSVPDYQGIDQSKLVPLLVGAIQEQQSIINDLIKRIENLEK